MWPFSSWAQMYMRTRLKSCIIKWVVIQHAQAHLETPSARPDNVCTNQGSTATSYVHHARSCKIHSTHSSKQRSISSEGRQPSIFGPHPVHHTRIHKPSHDCCVDKICSEETSFSYCTRDYCSWCCSKCPWKNPFAECYTVVIDVG